MFDYVDPRNREVQVEMEQAVTTHLKEIDGYLEPRFDPISFDEGEFEVEASVIIPVLNREKTVADAIESVMPQETDFEFNLILVDNHSTDGTTAIVRELASKSSQSDPCDPRTVRPGDRWMLERGYTPSPVR